MKLPDCIGNDNTEYKAESQRRGYVPHKGELISFPEGFYFAHGQLLEYCCIIGSAENESLDKLLISVPKEFEYAKLWECSPYPGAPGYYIAVCTGKPHPLVRNIERIVPHNGMKVMYPDLGEASQLIQEYEEGDEVNRKAVDLMHEEFGAVQKLWEKDGFVFFSVLACD